MNPQSHSISFNSVLIFPSTSLHKSEKREKNPQSNEIHKLTESVDDEKYTENEKNFQVSLNGCEEL